MDQPAQSDAYVVNKDKVTLFLFWKGDKKFRDDSSCNNSPWHTSPAASLQKKSPPQGLQEINTEIKQLKVSFPKTKL